MALTACAADEVRGNAAYEPATADPATQEQVVSTSNALGLTMLQSSDDNTNAVVSPASATTALAMLAPGASGEGVAAVEGILGADLDDAVDAISALTHGLAEYGGDPGEFDPEELPETPFLHIANNAVIQEDFELKEPYLDALVSKFDAGVLQADFADPGSKKILDEWVNHNTAGLIEESAVNPNELTRLVLQNAVLFGAQWQSRFADAGNEKFTPVEGRSFRVPMMEADRYIPLAEHDGWRAIAVPYGERFVSTFVLPPKGVDPLADGSQEIITQLQQDLASAEPSSLAVKLPVLDTEAKTSLKGVLQDLGHQVLFQCEEDPLGGMSEANLCIDDAVQQAVLRMDEDGTVAAAVTEVSTIRDLGAEGPPPSSFIADRPYLLTITDEASGWDLFQAVIRDPRS